MWVNAGAKSSRRSRYRLLAVLYGSQFVPLAFILYAMPAVLRQQGVPLELIGLLPLVGLVWVAKVAWAPLVDRFGSQRFGHYRLWLLAGQTVMVAGLLALAPLGGADTLPMAIAVVAVVAVASATHDIAADATAVRLLSGADRAMGNGIQKAGGFVGLMAGGGGGLVVYDRFGWVPALVVLAALTAIPLPALLRFIESIEVPVSQRPPLAHGAVVSFFRQPGAPRWAFQLLPLYIAGIALSLPLLNPILVDAGWPLQRIGLLSLVGGSTVALICALGTGALLPVVGWRCAMVGTALAQVVAIGALLVLALGSGAVPAGVAVVALLSGSYAAAGTVVYTVSMEWSRLASAGTDFTVQDSLVHLLTQLCAAAGLSLAGALGYSTALWGALLIAVLGTVVLHVVADKAIPVVPRL